MIRNHHWICGVLAEPNTSEVARLNALERRLVVVVVVVVVGANIRAFSGVHDVKYSCHIHNMEYRPREEHPNIDS
jgi:hypothetical protein